MLVGPTRKRPMAGETAALETAAASMVVTRLPCCSPRALMTWVGALYSPQVPRSLWGTWTVMWSGSKVTLSAGMPWWVRTAREVTVAVAQMTSGVSAVPAFGERERLVNACR